MAWGWGSTGTVWGALRALGKQGRAQNSPLVAGVGSLPAMSREEN